ncbi:MAG: hypothetical protein ABI743_12305 [bacterium]
MSADLPANPAETPRHPLIPRIVATIMCGLVIWLWFSLMSGPLLFFNPAALVGTPVTDLEERFVRVGIEEVAAAPDGPWDRAFNITPRGALYPTYLVVRVDAEGTVAAANTYSK